MSNQHDCIGNINQQLKDHNTRIAEAISLSAEPRELIQIATVKLDSSNRKKPANLFATYCPFCGVKLKGGAA